MKSAVTQSAGWGRRRWLLTILGLLAVQVVIVFLFGERARPIQKPVKPRSTFHLLPKSLTSRQLARSFFASDPTLFSSASLHSFSGPAWLKIELNDYPFPQHSKPTNWLALNVNQLGQLPDSAISRLRSPLQPVAVASPKIESFLNFMVPEAMKTQSVVRLEGDLVQRRTQLPRTLPSWLPTPELVTNSVIELAADASGEVISTRLVGHSGSPVADRKALEIARRLYFSSVSTPQDKSLMWGRLTFEWQTVLPLETNVLPVKIP